jgi:Flp pilus assembly protein TadB
MTISWLLAALGLIALPSDRAARTVATVDAAGPVEMPPVDRSPVPMKTLQLLVVPGLAVAAIGLVGVGPGLVASAVLAPIVVAMLRRLPDRAATGVRARGLPLTLDLVAAALRAGQPVGAALALASPAAGPALGRQLRAVSGLLRLGADPIEAWRLVADDPVLGVLAAVGQRSADSGIRLADAIERLARELRQQLRASAEARAQRVGVLAVAPLGLCFLPAFICIGIIPVVVGVAHGISTGVP